MLGSYAVGKTSLVRQFVTSKFSDQYLTTVGVKIDRKAVNINGHDVRMMLWDLHGEDGYQQVHASYLRGMAGYLLVADGTRPESMETVHKLHQRAVETVGSVPFILLVNKLDLVDEWAISDASLDELKSDGWNVQTTSAKTGERVNESFAELARQMLAVS